MKILWRQGTHQRNENSKLGFIESVYIQQCNGATLPTPQKFIPLHSSIVSSHLFSCLFLLSFYMPCRIVFFAKLEDLGTRPNHLSSRFLTKGKRLSYSPMTAWILLSTSSLVTYSMHEMFYRVSKLNFPQ